MSALLRAKGRRDPNQRERKAAARERARAAAQRAEAQRRKRAASQARRTATRADHQTCRVELPQMDWSRGLCVTLPAHARAWFTSEIADERAAAAEACKSCPILRECEAWAMSVSELYTRGTVYAALTPNQRRERRRLLTDITAAVAGKRA